MSKEYFTDHLNDVRESRGEQIRTDMGLQSGITDFDDRAGRRNGNVIQFMKLKLHATKLNQRVDQCSL